MSLHSLKTRKPTAILHPATCKVTEMASQLLPLTVTILHNFPSLLLLRFTKLKTMMPLLHLLQVPQNVTFGIAMLATSTNHLIRIEFPCILKPKTPTAIPHPCNLQSHRNGSSITPLSIHHTRNLVPFAVWMPNYTVLAAGRSPNQILVTT